MSINISGNYDISDREVGIVREIFIANNIKFKSIEKHKNANDGDVLVVLEDNKKLVIEVKEEDYVTRFSKYGDLGIDLISCFNFKKSAYPEDWKGLKKGKEVWGFFKQIDTDDPKYKLGKMSYSKSDLWLFFSVKPDGKLAYYSFFPGSFMTSDTFKQYLVDHCYFAVNNKPAKQLSHADPHHSAVFYINHKDPHLVANTYDISKLAKKDSDGYSDGGFGLD